MAEIEAIAATLGFPGVWFLNGSYQWGCTSLARDEESGQWQVGTALTDRFIVTEEDPAFLLGGVETPTVEAEAKPKRRSRKKIADPFTAE